MRWKFWRPKDENNMQCERFIKYNGTKIDLSGLGLDILKLGELGIESTLLQAASQSLMILDFSRYTLCNAVKNAPDQETRKRNYDLMMTDISRSNAVCEAIASLSLNPESKQLQSALKEILASRILRNQDRVITIEKETGSPQVFLTSEINEDKSIEIGKTSLEDKLVPIKKSFPPPKDSSDATGFTEEMYEKIEAFHTNIMYHRNEFEEDDGIITLYDKIRPDLMAVYRDHALMGKRGAMHLRGIAIKLGTLVTKYKTFEGTDTKDEYDLRIKIILAIEEVIEVVDSRFSQLANVMAQRRQ